MRQRTRGTHRRRGLSAAFATLLATAVVGTASATPATFPEQVWTRQFGSPQNDRPVDLAVDGSSLYITGNTEGRLAGTTDTGVFLRRYDTAGRPLWTRQFGSTATEEVQAVAARARAAYVAGYTAGSLGGQPPAGFYDAFVRQYDATGAVQWTRQFGAGTGAAARAVAVSPDAVFVAGDVLDGAFPENAAGGGTDGFLRRYSTDGTAAWTKQFGTTANDSVAAIAVTSAAVYVAGTTAGTLSGETPSGGNDAFVAKFGLDGTPLWHRQFGTPAYDAASAVSARGADLYVGGATNGELAHQRRALQDAFIRRYNDAGEAIWTKQFGTSDDDVVDGMGATATGVYLSGWTTGTVEGSSDVFASRYDASGARVWVEQFGTDDADYAAGLAVSPAGVYMAGQTAGSFGAPRVGGSDVFLTRLVSFRPDGTVSSPVSGPAVGNDVYNASGAAQTVTVTAPRSASRTFAIRAYNDGDATDAFRIDGCGSTQGFTVKYLKGLSGTQDITSSVAGGTFTMSGVVPGGSAAIRMVVSVADDAVLGTTKTCSMSITSVARPTLVDVVRGAVKAG